MLFSRWSNEVTHKELFIDYLIYRKLGRWREIKFYKTASECDFVYLDRSHC